jgi:hypothetical protein
MIGAWFVSPATMCEEVQRVPCVSALGGDFFTRISPQANYKQLKADNPNKTFAEMGVLLKAQWAAHKKQL